MSDETVGQRVRRLRLGRGLSQHALGRRIGISRQQVYNVERGDAQMRRTTLEHYAQALGVSAEYIRTGYEPGVLAGSLPSLSEYLRRTCILPDQDISTVVRIVQALEAQVAAETHVRDNVAAYDRPEMDDRLHREVDEWTN